ncbi:MAG: extracellular solute-binding protein [Clostridiaceae bacterium]|nr:extracellular solute-binding protein [Clostridiaceae bacterium]
MKKLMAFFLVVVLLLTMAAGCAKSQAPVSTPDGQNQTDQTDSKTDSNDSTDNEISATITYLTSQPLYAKNSDAINEELHKVHPKINVIIEHISDNYEAVLKTQMASSNAPDIFSWQGYLAMVPFVEDNKVADLSNESFDSIVFPNFLESGKKDGRQYGIPTIMQSLGLLYNKDVFEKAGITEIPRTISALKEAVEKIKAIGVQPFTSGLKDQWVCYDLFWFAQTPVMDDMMGWYNAMNEGKASFRTERTEKMFELFDFIYENSGDKPLSSDFAEMCHQLAAGTAAMAVQGDWAYEETQKIDPNANLGMMGLPVSEDPAESAIMADSAEILFVSEQSENKEAAVAFIKWMLSKEGAEYLGSITKTPSTSSLKPVIELNPFAADANKWVNDGNKAVPFAWNFWAPGIMDVVGKNIQAYFSGSITLDEFFEDLDNQWAKTVN